MRGVRLNIASRIIRACVTEDKEYCYVNGRSGILHIAIDNLVSNEVEKITGDVLPYSIETDEGFLVGYALIRFIDKRQLVSSFIRPLFRSRTTEFEETVDHIKKTALKPVR